MLWSTNIGKLYNIKQACRKYVIKHKYYHGHEERKDKEKMSQHENIVNTLTAQIL